MTDLSITAANVVQASDASTSFGTAGETITAGQVLYKDAADNNELKLADANGAAALRVPVGIALNGAAAGQPVRYITSGGLNPGATVVVGKIYVLSATAGGIAPVEDLSSGHYVSVLGIGTTTSNIQLNIQVSGVAVPAE